MQAQCWWWVGERTRLLREGRASHITVDGGEVRVHVPFLKRKFWAGVWGVNPRNHIHMCVLLSEVRTRSIHQILQVVLSQKDENRRMTWPKT